MAAASASSISSVGVLMLFAAVHLLVATSVTEATTADVTGGGDLLLLPVCKTVGGGSTFFDVEFCLSALGSDDRSGGAERYGDLSAIAVDLVTANATSTAAKIDGLIRAGGKDDGEKAMATTMTRCLRSCQALYGDVLRRQPGCAAAVKAARFGDAVASLEKSAAAVRECERGFGKGNVTSPVAGEDDSAFKLAKLAVGLLRFAY